MLLPVVTYNETIFVIRLFMPSLSQYGTSAFHTGVYLRLHNSWALWNSL